MTQPSDVRVTIDRLVRDRPSLQLDGLARSADYGISRRLVPYLCDLISPGTKTIETGSGLSTLICLLCGAEHVAISPDAGEPDRIRAAAREYGIPTEHYTPVTARSEDVLPQLDRVARFFAGVDRWQSCVSGAESRLVLCHPTARRGRGGRDRRYATLAVPHRRGCARSGSGLLGASRPHRTLRHLSAARRPGESVSARVATPAIRQEAVPRSLGDVGRARAPILTLLGCGTDFQPRCRKRTRTIKGENFASLALEHGC